MTIKAPIKTVFSFLEEAEKSKRWLPELESVNFPDGYNEENPTGTKMVQQMRDGGRVQHYVGEITNFKEPYVLSMRLANESFTSDITYNLSTIPEGTNLKFQGNLKSRSFFLTMLLPLIQLNNKRYLRRDMQRLKWAAEGSNNIEGV